MPYDGDVSKFEPTEHKLLRVLKRARELVATSWCQGGTGVRTEDGAFIADVTHPSATRFCALQAMNRAGWEVTGERASRFPGEVFSLFARGRTEPSVAAWNDAPERTRADVVAAFDVAIERAKLVTV